jgi:trans-2,3-dihydro-3-hydroxyanthranilate isomerase
MNVRYVTADVFTDRAFGGNQLAVFPDASGIAPRLMPLIAREFNYSETTFVLPPDDAANTARVRIFTPGGELPFAGHPTVGTAHVLAATGIVPLKSEWTDIVFEEGVGPVPVRIRADNGAPVFAQLSAAKLPEFGPKPPDRRTLARMLSLDEGDLLSGENEPEVVSCGVPFLFVPLKNRDALGRARVKVDLWEAALSRFVTSMLFVFTLDPELEGSDVRARMFAPGVGVPEDPATGSAAVALGGYLAKRTPRFEGTLKWIVEQGFEMGRPSILEVEVDKRAGEVVASKVGGSSVLVCEGTMRI